MRRACFSRDPSSTLVGSVLGVSALMAGSLLALALGATGCRRAPPVHDGPIVLVTFDALRSDVVGFLGGPPNLTPHLDAVAAEASWAGRGVASSSWTVPSMASIFTGLQPWGHGNWHGRNTVLQEHHLTLPEALKEAGFTGTAFRSNHWMKAKFGYAQGFDVYKSLDRGKRAEATLETLSGRRFVWIHILPPHAPYVFHKPFLDRVPEAPAALPPRITPLQLEPYYPPENPLPPEVRDEAWALYQLNTAWADDIFGRLMAALRRSGQWDQTLLAVTADHGEEFGEYGQVLHGGNLGRFLLEVPLVLKLPAGFQRDLAVEAGEPVANLRLWATLVQAVGGEVPPRVEASLFEAAPKSILSELYWEGGMNRFSLVTGDEQILWESSYSPPEEHYFASRLEELGGVLPVPLEESPDELFDRLYRAFDRTLPLKGRREQPPRISILRWTAEGSVPVVASPEDLDAAARRLRGAWIRSNGSERLPSVAGSQEAAPRTEEDEAELRALGYV